MEGKDNFQLGAGRGDKQRGFLERRPFEIDLEEGWIRSDTGKYEEGNSRRRVHELCHYSK